MAHPVYNVLAVGTSVHPAAELFQQTLFVLFRNENKYLPIIYWTLFVYFKSQIHEHSSLL